MTFPEHIANIPLLLVQQGWRLKPTDSVDDSWRKASPVNRWDYEEIEVDGAFLDIARPVIDLSNGPRVYAHQGWGDGLQPTLEMVKVWEWWWFGTCPTCINEGVLSPDGFLAIRSTQWLGPALPPVMP